jgi:hypothetical protein
MKFLSHLILSSLVLLYSSTHIINHVVGQAGAGKQQENVLLPVNTATTATTGGNPYGMIEVPVSVGVLKKGDLLVANWNDWQGFPG